MGFGRNPHVAKAEAAEARAREVLDSASEVRAFLEAAHLWGRAAAKEKEGQRRDEYEAKAEAARELSEAAAQKATPSAADLLAQLKGPRGED